MSLWQLFGGIKDNFSKGKKGESYGFSKGGRAGTRIHRLQLLDQTQVGQLLNQKIQYINTKNLT